VVIKGQTMLMTDITLKRLSNAGRFTDDQTKGLHLWIKPDSQKYWIFRYTLNNKRMGMSLGGYPNVGLKAARIKAVEAREKVNRGVCPISEKKASKAPAIKSKSPLFAEFALQYIQTMRPKWRNQKHGDQWVSTIQKYVITNIGSMRLDEIDTPHIQNLLMPIWLTKPQTASRLRGRLEKILSAAITSKHRSSFNPAIWKGHLENLLPTHKKSDSHHSALAYEELPDFISKLQEMGDISALSLEFTILNASRTGEVQLARWREIDGDIWTIPGNRMKAGKDHQVPLTQRALDILTIAKSMDPESEYCFSRNKKPLSNMAMLMKVRRMNPEITVHGFRSTFRDWVAEETDHSPEVAEMALAHTIGNKVEAAYRRGKLLERRRRLMRDWESFCLTGKWGNILQLNFHSQNLLVSNS
jgi:integrase